MESRRGSAAEAAKEKPAACPAWSARKRAVADCRLQLAADGSMSWPLAVAPRTSAEPCRSSFLSGCALSRGPARVRRRRAARVREGLEVAAARVPAAPTCRPGLEQGSASATPGRRPCTRAAGRGSACRTRRTASSRPDYSVFWPASRGSSSSREGPQAGGSSRGFVRIVRFDLWGREGRQMQAKRTVRESKKYLRQHGVLVRGGHQ